MTPQEPNHLNRRAFARHTVGSIALGSLGLGATLAQAQPAKTGPAGGGRIKQASCRGAFGKVSIEEMCRICVKLGLHGIDMVKPEDWPILKKHDLICTMVSSHKLRVGLNRIENHEGCLATLEKSIHAAADAEFPNVICFSGNREGLSDEEGIKNCVIGLKQIAPLAEKKGITLCMELLNSKRNHKDYQCDRTHWGAEVCKQVGSPRVKLLYDIYHMQVQEGDVIATIREYIDYIAHIHTAGVPGRHEIDESQELYYPAIMRAIADLDFEGYVAHEYRPIKDPMECLAKAVELCDV